MPNEDHQASSKVVEMLDRAEQSGLLVYRLHEWAELTCMRCGDSRDLQLTSSRPEIQIRQIDRFIHNHSH
ncbi:hypothetical protein AB0J83_19240 [Actinoplanes sp. NPDC049596]|uniref:hypothetical protein n=1 Tax=unclassified Actinoplanes TaxID=2626549 RepID=UPI003430C121